jgi:16S rRNA processing protein RimM
MTERVTVGRIVKPHGIRGELVVLPLSDVPDRFAVGTELDLDGRAVTVSGVREHQGRLLVRLDGVLDRTAAELLRGRELTAPPVDVDELEHYLVSELIGARVAAADGTVLGTVRSLIELPAAAGYDLLEVGRPDGSSWLLPSADALVEAVEDVAGLTLVLTEAAAGLAELGAATGDSSGGSEAIGEAPTTGRGGVP